MRMCEYPGCKNEATERIRLADPDCEGNVYCKECAKKAWMNTQLELFGMNRKRKR